MNSVTRKPSLGAGKLSKSMYGVCSVTVTSLPELPHMVRRIEKVRSALAKVLPNITQFRRVGLITFGPGRSNQCNNIKLQLKPTPNAADLILGVVNNFLVPTGGTPLTAAVEQAANVLNFRKRPGIIVLLTDGEETCGRSPCELGAQL